MEVYEDQVVDWKLEVREAERAAAAEQARIAEHNKKIEMSWKTRTEAAREKYEDFDECLKATIPLHPRMDQYIVHAPLGAEILYFLYKNPARAAELAAMPDWQIGDDLSDLRRSLSEPEPEPVKTEAPAPPKPKVTSAPPPVADVGGRGAATTGEVPLKSENFSTYRERMDAQERAAR